MLPLPAQHEWAGRRAAACGRAGRPTSAVPGVAAQTTTAQTVWVVNFYSITKTKQNTTINPATVMTMSAMLNRPGWQRHCDDESVHRYSVWMIDQCDVTIASGSHIDDVTIAKLLTFEIISGAARNERYGFVYLRLRVDSITNEQWYFAMVNITRGWIHARDDRFSKFRGRN